MLNWFMWSMWLMWCITLQRADSLCRHLASLTLVHKSSLVSQIQYAWQARVCLLFVIMYIVAVVVSLSHCHTLQCLFVHH